MCVALRVCTSSQYSTTDISDGVSDRQCLESTECDTAFKTDQQLCSIGGTRTCTVRNNYILNELTPTSNRICVPWEACHHNQYMHKEYKTNHHGFVYRNQTCKTYTQCNQNQFHVVDGNITQDRDNVCGFLTACSENEFESMPPTYTSDRICQSHSLCDYTTEYVLRMGSSHTDTECALKTICTDLSGGYMNNNSVNSIDSATLGQDATCANFTICAAGNGVVVTGNSVSDYICEPCGPGTFSEGILFQKCMVCPSNHFSNGINNTICTRSNECMNQSFLTLGDATSDAECTICPSTWGLSAPANLCTQCAPGHVAIDDESLSMEEKCRQCSENFFCPSAAETRSEMCPDIRIFKREGTDEYSIVPSSPLGSVFPQQCECNLHGGQYAINQNVRRAQRLKLFTLICMMLCFDLSRFL